MSQSLSDIYPLTPAQQGILFHCLLDPASGQYVIQLYFRLEHLDHAIYLAAWQYVLGQQAVLRTSFIWEDMDEPLQVVHKHASLPLHEESWETLSDQERQERLEQYLAGDRAHAFDLSDAPLMRLALFQLGNESYQIVWTFHHLILDGWSQSLLLAQIKQYYMAAVDREPYHLPPSRPFRDYVAWLQQQDRNQARDFWQQRLSGFRKPTFLHIYANQHSQSGQGYGEHLTQFSSDHTQALYQLAKKHSLTVNTIIQGLWAILLSRYSGEDDVVFGATVSGRPADMVGVEHGIGMYINTLPVRAQISPQASLISWLQHLQEEQFATRYYEYSSLVDIQAQSDVPQEVPFFNSILVFENYPNEEDGMTDNLLVQHAFGYREKTNYPLTIDVMPETHLKIKALYDGECFSNSAIVQIFAHFQRILIAALEQPERVLSSLSVLDAHEQAAIVKGWNETAYESDETRCLHHLIEEQVQRTPTQIAVITEHDQLTYQELDQRANKLAHILRQQGIGPDAIVGVCMERSIELMVALLGILKAGGVYLPLDIEAPPARLAQLLKEAHASTCVTQHHLQHLTSNLTADLSVLILDQDTQRFDAQHAQPPDVLIYPDHLVSIYYTSGSTGIPKGVASTHRGWVNRMRWMQAQYPLREGESVLHKTTLTFDDAAVELFWPLLVGGRVALLEPGLHRDPVAILQAARRHKVVVLHFVPSMLGHFLDLLRTVPEPVLKELRATLRLVVSSGEALLPEMVSRFLELFGTSCVLTNQWGATEASIDSTFHLCDASDVHARASISVGRPLRNNQVYILDRWYQPVPVGVAGDLYLAGIGLARGYLHDRALTAAKFLPHPFQPGERLYCTGDRGYYRADGQIMFLGRLDNQVKLRGMRVELGEIEQVLSSHPDISEAVVVVQESTHHEKSLVAYITKKREVASNDLNIFLAGLLPGYMLPRAIVPLEMLPHTASGKIDRRALPNVEINRDASYGEYIAPRTTAEVEVAGIWSQILGLETIGVFDDFFRLGGHSLLAIRIVAYARSQFDLDIPLRALFEHPTIAEFAAAIEDLLLIEIGQMNEEVIYDQVK